MWFPPLLRSLHSVSRRPRRGYLSKNPRPGRLRLELEILETRFLPSGFGSVGYVLTNLLAGGWTAKAVALQPDGKILAAGYNGGNPSAFGLVRYNSDGTLDTSFNGTGIVLTSFSGRGNAQSGAGYALALQSDGKIIEAGRAAGAMRGDWDAALARFNTNGTLDTTFGTGKKSTGQVTTDFGATDDSIQGLAVQPLDGKIVAVGTSNGRMEVARYNTNGSLDSTFGSGGLVSAAGTGVATGMALQADGKIVASADIGTQFEIVRFNTNGTLDTSFGGTGIVTTMIGSDTTANTYAIAIYPNAGTANDGKIVAVGRGNSPVGGVGHFTWVIARYNLDGSLDSTFGTGGIVQSNYTGDYVAAYAVAIQSDGKIVVTGKNNFGASEAFAVDRFNTDGSLDTTFGSGGIAVTQVGSCCVGPPDTYGVALQTNGQIVVAGDAFDGTNIDFLVARYDTNGTLDPVTSSGGDSSSSSDSVDQNAGRFFFPASFGNSDSPAPAGSTHESHWANRFDIGRRLAAEDSSLGRHDSVSHSGRMASGSTHAFWSDLDATLLFPTFNFGAVAIQP